MIASQFKVVFCLVLASERSEAAKEAKAQKVYNFIYSVGSLNIFCLKR
jgi:hypothetical protein